LEYGSESESKSDTEDEAITEPIPDPKLIEPYQLPPLKPASSYEEYRRRNDELAPRFLAAAEG
jgi:hypothetical protein